MLRGDRAGMQAPLAQLHRVAEQYLPMLRPWDKVYTGYVRVYQGDAAGLDLMRQGLADWAASGSLGGYVYQHLLLSEACLHSGQIEAGLQVAAEALALIESRDLRMYEAEIRRVQGELWRAQGDEARAVACFRQALDVAQQQGARLSAQRATASLAGSGRSPDS